VLEQGTHKVAVLYINNDYGVGLAENFEKAFSMGGGEVTQASAFEPSKASYRGELQAVTKGDPEALLLIAYPDDGGVTILKQALEEGFFERFIFTDGMKAEKIVEQIGAEILEGGYGTSPKALDTDTAQAFKTIYEQAHGELPPLPFIDTSYDAAAVLLLAIAQAGSTDGVAVRDALREVTNAPGTEIIPGELAKGLELIAKGEAINFVGAAGDHEFDAQGDVSGTFEHWVIKDGRMETVRVFKPE
jgi:ABC-type branched-subunit amino acid transport system substrate-binding protein